MVVTILDLSFDVVDLSLQFSHLGGTVCRCFCGQPLFEIFQTLIQVLDVERPFFGRVHGQFLAGENGVASLIDVQELELLLHFETFAK